MPFSIKAGVRGRDARAASPGSSARSASMRLVWARRSKAPAAAASGASAARTAARRWARSAWKASNCASGPGAETARPASRVEASAGRVGAGPARVSSVLGRSGSATGPGAPAPRSAASVKYPATVGGGGGGASFPSVVLMCAVLSLRGRIPASEAGPLLCCVPAMDDPSDQGAPVELSEEETAVMLGCYADTPIAEALEDDGPAPRARRDDRAAAGAAPG